MQNQIFEFLQGLTQLVDPCSRKPELKSCTIFRPNFLKLCTRDPLLRTQLLSTHFFKIRPTSGFMAYFRFTLVLFLKNHRFDQFSRAIAQNDQQDLKIILREKKFWFEVKFQIWGHLGSNFKFHIKRVNCISK